jgi:hypothetical protein
MNEALREFSRSYSHLIKKHWHCVKSASDLLRFMPKYAAVPSHFRVPKRLLAPLNICG